MNDLKLKSNLFYSVIIFIAMTLGCKEQECSSYCFKSIKQSKTCCLTLCDTSKIERITSYNERFDFKKINIVIANPRRSHTIYYGNYYPLHESIILPQNLNVRPRSTFEIDINLNGFHSSWRKNIKFIKRHIVNGRSFVSMKSSDNIREYKIESNFISDTICISIETFYFPSVDTNNTFDDKYHFDLLKSLEFKDTNH